MRAIHMIHSNLAIAIGSWHGKKDTTTDTLEAYIYPVYDILTDSEGHVSQTSPKLWQNNKVSFYMFYISVHYCWLVWDMVNGRDSQAEEGWCHSIFLFKQLLFFRQIGKLNLLLLFSKSDSVNYNEKDVSVSGRWSLIFGGQCSVLFLRDSGEHMARLHFKAVPTWS